MAEFDFDNLSDEDRATLILQGRCEHCGAENNGNIVLHIRDCKYAWLVYTGGTVYWQSDVSNISTLSPRTPLTTIAKISAYIRKIFRKGHQ